MEKEEEGRKEKRVTYDKRDPLEILLKDQHFGDVFCKECREGIEKPHKDDGTEMCNRQYHKGYCFKDCKRLHKKKKLVE